VRGARTEALLLIEACGSLSLGRTLQHGWRCLLEGGRSLGAAHFYLGATGAYVGAPVAPGRTPVADQDEESVAARSVVPDLRSLAPPVEPRARRSETRWEVSHEGAAASRAHARESQAGDLARAQLRAAEREASAEAVEREASERRRREEAAAEAGAGCKDLQDAAGMCQGCTGCQGCRGCAGCRDLRDVAGMCAGMSGM
jgi:hypothetical protein